MLSEQETDAIETELRNKTDWNKTDKQEGLILLCSDTDKTIAKYSVLNDSNQIFASKYITMLPTEEELTHEIERQMEIFRETHPMQS